ncbi:MAG: hypothetical protein ACE5FI_16020, partial [Anaerolineales bacterium]
MKKTIWPLVFAVALLLLAAPLTFAQETEDEAVAALAAKFDSHKISDFPGYESVSRCWDGSGVTYQNADYVNDEAFSLLEPEWLLVNPNTEDIVAVSYLVKTTDGAPAEWIDEFRALWPNQQATFGSGWTRLPVW